jgi:hypothetical protein
MHFASIESAAQWSVREDDVGLRLQRWKPFPRRSVGALERFPELEAAE